MCKDMKNLKSENSSWVATAIIISVFVALMIACTYETFRQGGALDHFLGIGG